MANDVSTELKSRQARHYFDQAKDQIMEIIPRDEFAVFLFGSRVAHKDLRYSDIDIGVYGEQELPLSVKTALEEAMDESNIPFDLELVDFRKVSGKFKKEALQNIEVWNDPKNFMKNLKC